MERAMRIVIQAISDHAQGKRETVEIGVVSARLTRP